MRGIFSCFQQVFHFGRYNDGLNSADSIFCCMHALKKKDVCFYVHSCVHTFVYMCLCVVSETRCFLRFNDSFMSSTTYSLGMPIAIFLKFILALQYNIDYLVNISQ